MKPMAFLAHSGLCLYADVREHDVFFFDNLVTEGSLEIGPHFGAVRLLVTLAQWNHPFPSRTRK